MHFFNHNALSVTFNAALLIIAVYLQSVNVDTYAATIIKMSAWFVFFVCVTLHAAHTVWLHNFAHYKYNEGYSRHQISKFVAEIEIKHEFSLLSLHMFFRSADSFEEMAVAAYIRTVRFRKYDYMSSKNM